MSLRESGDYELVAATINAEIDRAYDEGSIARGSINNRPTAGGLSVCASAGDFFLLDNREPRHVSWLHPLSATQVSVMHLWGPSPKWKDLMLSVTNYLIGKGFTTARFVPGNPLSVQAKNITLATGTGEVSVLLAQAKTRLTAAGGQPLP